MPTFTPDVSRLQRWSPEQQKTITAGLLKFLKGQKYEKEAALGRVLPAMEQVVKDSHLITVILVFDWRRGGPGHALR